MTRKRSITLYLPLLLILLAPISSTRGPVGPNTRCGAEAASLQTARAANQSVSTSCAEQDNVNIPIFGKVTVFEVEAIHPTYPNAGGRENCRADFTDCPVAEPAPSPPPDTVFELYDDHRETLVEAVRVSSWWQPQDMTVSVDGGRSETNVHYVRIKLKIADEFSWPEVAVVYQDANVRLKPHPPAGVQDVCFGSSVLIGSAPVAGRPFADIASIRYIPTTRTIEITYRTGGSTTIALLEVNRTKTRARVTVDCQTDTTPCITFRSMFVREGKADVDSIRWLDAAGVSRDGPVMDFSGGDGTEWLFYRQTRSEHNTPAPDIRIKILSVAVPTPTPQPPTPPFLPPTPTPTPTPSPTPIPQPPTSSPLPPPTPTPTPTPPPVQLILSLNKTVFRRGDSLILTVFVTPGPAPLVVDAYVAVGLPGGTWRFMEPSGTFVWETRPVAPRWVVAPLAGREVFRYTFAGNEPTGTYWWVAGFTEPGTLNIIKRAEAVFTFSP